jgi:hypothetical protein
VLHTMLALMTTGPVGFSDAVGRTNATLLAATALPDGTLVQPSRPATPLDLTYGDGWSNKGFVLSTHSSSWGWYIIAHQLDSPFHAEPSRDLVFPAPVDPSAMLWRVWDGTQGGCINGSAVVGGGCASRDVPAAPAAVKGPEWYRPTLLVGSWVCPSGFSLLGDLTKFASLSTTLFRSVECTWWPSTLHVSFFFVCVCLQHARKP